MNKKHMYLGIIGISLLSILLGILGIALQVGSEKAKIGVFKVLSDVKIDSVKTTATVVVALGILAILGGVAIIIASLQKIQKNDENMKTIYIMLGFVVLILIFGAISLGFNRERLNDPIWIVKEALKEAGKKGGNISGWK